MPINSWEELVVELEKIKKPAALVKADKNKGPILDLYGVELSKFSKLTFAGEALKTKLLTLMMNLHEENATKVIDYAAKKDDRNPKEFGSMRQIHWNDCKFLPRHPQDVETTLKDKTVTGKTKVYNDYAIQFKKHTNDQGGGNTPTGYVEYTAGTNELFSGGIEARIVLDYVNMKVYLAPNHYKSWKPTAQPTQEVDRPAHGSGLPNPFYRILFAGD